MEQASVDPVGEAILPRLYERDIDVALQEELLFNPAVVALFCRAVGLDPVARVLRCELSVVDRLNGETDVLATLDANGQRIVMLIENKIDAIFQPRQPERYRERAASLMMAGECDRAVSVLVAPKSYAADDDPTVQLFDAWITYEALASAIESDGTPRAKHRGVLVRRALEAARTSYVMDPSPAATELWARIYRIATEHFPALGMKPPTEKGAGGYWVQFKADFPKSIMIDWKITKGVVDLSFWDTAVHRPSPDIDLADLGRPARFERMQTMVAIRTLTMPPTDHWSRIGDEHIHHALAAAADLHAFYRRKWTGFA